MEELIEILKELHSDIDYEKCNTLIDESILDSFDIVTIVAEVDDRIGVTIPADEITTENFNSAQALWDLIQRLDNE